MSKYVTMIGGAIGLNGSPLTQDRVADRLNMQRSQLTEANAVSDRWQKDCRWYQEQYADCATELKEAKAAIAEQEQLLREGAELAQDVLNINAKQHALMQRVVDARAERSELEEKIMLNPDDQETGRKWARSITAVNRAIDDMAKHLEEKDD